MKELNYSERLIAPDWAVFFGVDDDDILFIDATKPKACWLVDDFEHDGGVDLQDEFEITTEYEHLLIDIYPIDTTCHNDGDDL